MLKPNKSIYCGVYNSFVINGSAAGSRERTVTFYELELFHEKLGTSHVDGKAYRTDRGMLLCAKPGQKRHSEFPVKCSFIRIFTEELDPSLCKMLEELPTVTYISDVSETDDLLALFTKLGTLFTMEAENCRDLKINALFYEILERILRVCGMTSRRTDAVITVRCVREAYEYRNENYARNCSLGCIAEAVSISPNYLHAVFTQTIGMTPLEYVTKKRIERAKQLIMIGESSMLEIALEVGFCSQSHFSKVFRENTGLTPLAYKKKLLQQY